MLNAQTFESSGSSFSRLRYNPYSDFKAFLFVFGFAYVILFLGIPLRPNFYDEAVILTGSMQVAAGQIPYRDFFTVYGPASYYVLAALFKLFGQSILIERMVDLFFRALLVASVYTIVFDYLRRQTIAAWTSFAEFLWVYGLSFETAGTAVIPASFFALMSTALVLPIFLVKTTRRRMLFAGILTGIGTLYRYDMGIALIAVHSCIVIAGIWQHDKSNRLAALLSALSSYLAGFILIIAPPAIYYLSTSPIQPLVYDAITFPGKYYYRSRNLPFPGIGFKSLDNLAIYLPIPIIGLSFYSLTIRLFRSRGVEEAESPHEGRRLNAFLFGFALLALAMYSKCLVRTSVTHSYLASIPSLLLLAALLHQRWTYQRGLRLFVQLLAVLSLIAPAWAVLKEIHHLKKENVSLEEMAWRSSHGTMPAIENTWCNDRSPATRGMCFLPLDDEIQTIEFLENNTRSDQTLFVGVPGHDKIFANDMLIYFAAHRLPATTWAEFDADLQNQSEIQNQMIRDLDGNRPPYIVLDSKLQQVYEPNDSSRSSGVVLLDDYIHKHYRPARTFGTMSIWQRIH